MLPGSAFPKSSEGESSLVLVQTQIGDLGALEFHRIHMRISIDLKLMFVILGFVTNMDNSNNATFRFLCTSTMLTHYQINKIYLL